MASGGGMPQMSRVRIKPDGNRDAEGLRRIAAGEAHPPRASDLAELRALQKAGRERDGEVEGRAAQSLSETLRSSARRAGPRVIRGQPDERYVPGSPRVMEHSSSGFVKAMSDAGLKPTLVYHNLSVAELYEKALQYEPSSHIVAGGALATISGARTGRSPRDRRIVREPSTEQDVWWGEGCSNHEMDESTFTRNRERAVDYLNQLERLYVCDGYVCWDPATRYRVRVVCGRPSHALYAHNMLIRPTEEQLVNFGRPHLTLYNAGAFPANRYTSYMTSSTSVAISLERKEMVILGTQYAGEMKLCLFTLLNYLLPKRGILSLNAGCNVGSQGDATLFFGLSGTGKTTLSADPSRHLIGDDKQGWGDSGVFNLEGGCYAKCIGLSKEREPLIHCAATRFGSILENVCFDEEGREVDWDASRITENTRAAYPIEYIANAKVPCVGGHPKNLIMLCCDAFGVLPPVSRLSRQQALFYFLSGFTARVAASDQGGINLEPTFSACYAASALVWHPTKYAAMLAEKLEQHGSQVWLLNTGWTGGRYGVGYRIPLQHTRAIVDAIHSGELATAEYQTLPCFNLEVPRTCSGVPQDLLLPANTWPDREAYDEALHQLAQMFVDNFRQFEGGSRFLPAERVQQIAAAGPAL